MQLTLSLEDFNAFITVYLKAIMYEEVDHKAGLKQRIENSGNPEAVLLLREREKERNAGKWDVNKEKGFNDQIHEIMPELNMKSVTEFDDFIKMLSDRNLDQWLMIRYFRQEPRMRLYLKRFIDQIEGDDNITVRLIT